MLCASRPCRDRSRWSCPSPWLWSTGARSRGSCIPSSPGLFKWTNHDSTEGRDHFRLACLPTLSSYRFSQNLIKISWTNAKSSGNTLSSGNYHSSLSGMCARHQTGVWRVPSCPLLEEKLSKPWMKNIFRAVPVLNTDFLNMYYKNENLLWKTCLFYTPNRYQM